MLDRNAIQELAGLSLSEALRRILADLDADSGTIHALHEDDLLHLLEYAGNIPEQLLPVIQRIPIGKGMAGLTVQRSEPMQICNLQTDLSGDARAGAKATGMKGSICVPMLMNEAIVGVLGIATEQEREFNEEEIDWLMEVGSVLTAEF